MEYSKYLVILMFFLSMGASAQSQHEADYHGYANSIRLGSGRATVYEYDWSRHEYRTYTDNYDIVEDHGVPFIEFVATKQRWLSLLSPYFATIYKSETEPFFQGTGSVRGFEYLIVGRFSATSSLTEGGASYRAENLRSDAPSKPWVEGAEGSGIGEKVTVDWLWKKGQGGATGAIIISSGFVSYDKPYLYEMNNRPKTLRIADPSTGSSFDVTLEDTPNPQVFFLSAPPEISEIEILSVYPGTKWNDTCINYIRGLEWGEAQQLRSLMDKVPTIPDAE